MNPKRIKSYILLILVAAIWGAAGPIIKFTLDELPPFTFLTYRFFLTLLVLVPIMIGTKERFPQKSSQLFMLLILSFLGSTLNLGLLFYGIKYTTVLDQSLISATAPIFVIFASLFFLKEHVTKKEKIGIAITFLGTLAIVIQPLLEGETLAQGNTLGNILILLSNIAWVGYIIISKKQLREEISPLIMAVSNFYIGLITFLPLAIIENQNFQGLVLKITSISFASQLGVIYMALLSGALGYYLFQVGQKSIEASEAILFSYLQPIFSAPLAVFWLKEKISLPFIIGTIIISLGVLIAEIKKKNSTS